MIVAAASRTSIHSTWPALENTRLGEYVRKACTGCAEVDASVMTVSLSFSWSSMSRIVQVPRPRMWEVIGERTPMKTSVIAPFAA
jgi:hypothetical protein